MMAHSQFALVLLVLFVGSSYQAGIHLQHSGFCYEDDSTCGQKSPKWDRVCQTGQEQSPIDLFDNPLSWVTAPPVDFKASGLSFPNSYVLNTGHAIQLQAQPDPTSTGTLTGHGLNGTFVFSQAHFHWGQNDFTGSEHRLNGFHFPMEVHLVFYSNKFGSLKDAVLSGTKDSVAVVGRFIREALPIIGDILDPVDMINLNKMIPTLPSYNHGVATALNQPIDFNKFMPQAGARFFRYHGSLTTPSCTESVVWSMFERPLAVHLGDVARFRRLKDEDDFPLSHNFREIQKLNARKVEHYSVKAPSQPISIFTPITPVTTFTPLFQPFKFPLFGK